MREIVESIEEIIADGSMARHMRRSVHRSVGRSVLSEARKAEIDPQEFLKDRKKEFEAVIDNTRKIVRKMDDLMQLAYNLREQILSDIDARGELRNNDIRRIELKLEKFEKERNKLYDGPFKKTRALVYDFAKDLGIKTRRKMSEEQRRLEREAEEARKSRKGKRAWLIHFRRSAGDYIRALTRIGETGARALHSFEEIVKRPWRTEDSKGFRDAMAMAIDQWLDFRDAVSSGFFGIFNIFEALMRRFIDLAVVPGQMFDESAEPPSHHRNARKVRRIVEAIQRVLAGFVEIYERDEDLALSLLRSRPL